LGGRKNPAIALFAALGWQTANGFDETFGTGGAFRRKSARLGSACGAIVVTKHGCANFMPTYAEVMAFVNARGGL